jgi:uroporphyrinogen decarboxylase
MRQAGSCLAEYRDLRERYDILTIAKTPELCAPSTLTPIAAYGVDAAVMHADVMLPMDARGWPAGLPIRVAPKPPLGLGARAPIGSYRHHERVSR